MATLHTKTLKQRQVLVKREADKIRDILQKKADEKVIIIKSFTVSFVQIRS